MRKHVAVYDYVRSLCWAENAGIAGLPPALQEARIFAKSLEIMPLELRAEDRLAGWFGWDAPPQIETPAPKRTPRLRAPEEIEEMARFCEQYNIRPCVDKAHTCADYQTILRKGLIWYEARIERALAAHPGDVQLTAMWESLAAVRDFATRLSRQVEDAAAREGLPARKARLQATARALARVPYLPAEDFLQAIQAVWIIHFAIPLAEDGWYSISLGRFDQYIAPYYKEAIARGVPAEELAAALFNFYDLLNGYADGACALNLGGADADGREMYNDFSFVLLECAKRAALPAPLFTARISPNTTDETMCRLIDKRLFEMGQPTFYGEYACREALKARGISETEAIDFSLNSCMALSLAGQEYDSMWGCVFNVNLALELALNQGRMPDGGEVPLGVPARRAPTNIEELFVLIADYARALMTRALALYERLAESVEAYEPDPFLSAITEDCIEARRDRVSGARYQNATVECMGLADAADGICAVDTLVFQRKEYALAELVDAVRDNFEHNPRLYASVLRCPKYGANDAYADGMAARLSRLLADLIRGFSHDNRHYLPSLHTLDANVSYGARWHATFNGRKRGAPFAKNAGPQNSVRGKDCTAALLSASALPQSEFSGGQPIDVHFSGKDLESDERKLKIARLIRTYFARGGLQLQVNSLSADTLKAALRAPEDYRDLIVRIGGFSIYFNSISEASKREFIERFEREEA